MAIQFTGRRVTEYSDDLMDPDDHAAARAHLDGITHPIVCVAEGNVQAAAHALGTAVELLDTGG